MKEYPYDEPMHEAAAFALKNGGVMRRMMMMIQPEQLWLFLLCACAETAKVIINPPFIHALSSTKVHLGKVGKDGNSWSNMSFLLLDKSKHHDLSS